MSRRRPARPLGRLLDLRRQEERDRAARVSQLRDRLEHEERRLEALEKGRSSLRGAARTAAQLQAQERLLAGLRRRVAELREARRRAAAAVKGAQDSLVEAVRRREAVERTWATRSRERRRADVARDQRMADDAGHAAFRRRRGGN